MRSRFPGWCRGASAVATLVVLVTASCSRPGLLLREGETVSLRGGPSTLRDPSTVYARAGLLASAEPMPFTGWARFLAGPTPDSALALVALSFPARTFSFMRENEAYRARFDVTIEFRREGETIRRVQSRENVVVASFRETSRDEESVIFQQYVTVPPGAYALLVVIRDSVSAREASAALRVTAPRFESAGVASPVPVYEAEGRRSIGERPRLIPNARASAVFVRDSSTRVYIESYGAASRRPLRLRVLGDSARVLYELALPPVPADETVVSGRVIELPLTHFHMGVTRLEVTPQGQASNGMLASSPFLVGLGEGLVVASFEEVLDYLRWFATPDRLRTLQEVPASGRATAWARFLQETDPAPETAQHEGLRDYLGRLETANVRFREGAVPGWLTDRGMVFSALGEPDRESEPLRSGDTAGLGFRMLLWEYDALRARIVFIDRSGMGEWRLTSSSENDFREIVRQRRVQ